LFVLFRFSFEMFPFFAQLRMQRNRESSTHEKSELGQQLRRIVSESHFIPVERTVQRSAKQQRRRTSHFRPSTITVAQSLILTLCVSAWLFDFRAFLFVLPSFLRFLPSFLPSFRVSFPQPRPASCCPFLVAPRSLLRPLRRITASRAVSSSSPSFTLHDGWRASCSHLSRRYADRDICAQHIGRRHSCLQETRASSGSRSRTQRIARTRRCITRSCDPVYQRSGTWWRL
jgi:hypothetical protein